MNSEQRDFLYLLGYGYLVHGKISKALVLLQALLVVHDSDCKVLQAIAYCLLSMKRYEEAMEMAERAIIFSNREELSLTLLLKARALLHLGRKEEGRAIMTSLRGK